MKPHTLTIILAALFFGAERLDAQAIAGGGFHSLFRCSSGEVMACGRNQAGQLGDGTLNMTRLFPVQVNGLAGISAVSSSQIHSLFLKNDGNVWACGSNSEGELGDGTTTGRSSPVLVSGINGITAVAAGGFHSLFLKNDGTVWGCGYNSLGALGDGTSIDKTSPVQVSGLSGIIAVSAGYWHSLFLKDDGTVWTCGRNNSGQLGDGTTTTRYSPVQVNGLSGIVAVAGGWEHSLFLKNDATVWACGRNQYGQLGDSTTTDRYSPVQVNGFSGIVAVAGGGSHSLFLKNDATVWACGLNGGQLGDGTITNRASPVQVNGLSGIIAVAGGGNHSLFLKNNGTVWVCGDNDFGQLGDGSLTIRISPGQVQSLCTVSVENSTSYTVRGNILGDVNTNCTFDSSDISLPGTLIKAEPGPIYGMSDFTGNYIISLFDTGSYTISVATQDARWQSSCSTSYSIQVATIPDTASNINFAMQVSYHCPSLTVEISTPRLRRCFSNTYTIHYANTGTLPATNAYIKVDFGKNLQLQNSTLPWSTVSGSVYTFPIGNLNIYQQGEFNITALLDCATQLNSTQCVTAHIYPDSICLAPSPSWDKSDMTVTGDCINDSLVCFTIWNNTGAGDMNGPAQYRLYVNDTLMLMGTYQLARGDTNMFCYPANGKTYRLEADQRPNHPGNSHPRSTLEACGTNNNGGVDFGFVNSVAEDDEDLFVETFCMEVTGSFDPNDKQVSPTGITANKYIKPEDELEYLIRFQNTGNDTAFKVVIRDTIQTDVIDIATLTSGASSHNYTFNIYGHGIAEWTFDNILLPDSNVNEEASHGFVKFKAKLLPNIAPGTIVTNSADIYFDFNAPVVTNEVWNTVFDTVIRGTVVISGNVLTESGVPVPGVMVKLSDAATDSVVTATDGSYRFEVESGHDYSIAPLKNNDSIPSNGITTYDILRMRQHLLGMGALPSPYKLIAASEVNADADTSITTQDIVFIRSLILGNTASFPGNRLWQFVSSEYLFPDSSHPFPFNKTRTYTNVISNQTNQNFIGIKLGDVNESWEE